MLELEGKPYSMSKADVEKYSGRWIFRVGTQYIIPNKIADPEMNSINIAPIHVTLAYPKWRLENSDSEPGKKVRMFEGTMRYYESKNFKEEQKIWIYSPIRMQIGYTGSLIVDNKPELAFFLDNHPYNEVVQKNPEHHNYVPDATPYFATYRKEAVRKKRISEQEIIQELLAKVHNKQETGIDELKAIAKLVHAKAIDYGIAHKLHAMHSMEDADFRAELGRLSIIYPHAMKELMESEKIDFYAWIEKFIDIGLIKVRGEMWKITENGKAEVDLCKVKSGSDHKATLVNWFQASDKLNRKFGELKQKHQAIELRMAAEKVS